MGETTAIEWTDASWNPLRARRGGMTPAPIGWHCEHVSEGCRNCYAEALNKRLGTGLDYKPGYLEPHGPVTPFLDEKLLLAPMKWRKPRRIFLSSMTDIFGDWVSDADLDRIFAVMALCPQHTFQVLTKRPERMRDYLAARLRPNAEAMYDLLHGPAMRTVEKVMQCGVDAAFPLPNVWLGVSVEDQAAADARIPLLLATPAAKRFLSCEPLLGPVDLTRIHETFDNGLGHSWESCLNGKRFSEWGGDGDGGEIDGCPNVDWVIAGGESGPGARPMHPDWARSLRDQCAAAGVPFLFKQWGEWLPLADAGWHFIDHLATDAATQTFRRGKKRAGRLLDGVQHDGVPE